MLDKIRRRLRSIIQPFLWKAYSFYARKDRWHSYQGIKVLVKPSVFHPGFLISTHVFVNFLAKQNLADKKILEVGTGSGLMALFCKKQGAEVMATDINSAAVSSLRESCKINELELEIIHSDLFQQLPKERFDLIISNPPYFPKRATNDKEKAFFCGPEFQFFHKFFENANDYLVSNGIIYMILSDDCDLVRIESIANNYLWKMEEVHRVRKWGEWNMIYELEK